MSYIYKIVNDINDKVYIGKTEFSIYKRFKEHCADSIKRREKLVVVLLGKILVIKRVAPRSD